ncbi:MAG TPA: hypothetical protein VKI44_38725 [Acetobacteraceae bacterium]|nr:hypothetical protein [Acetobacteraceae bacterium]
MSERHAADFRGFEEETSVHQEFDGAGVLATRENIVKMPTLNEQGFFHDEIPLGSHEVGAYINQFPLEAAAASYVFTLIEVFGNKVAKLVNPNSLDRNKAWHEDVRGFANLGDSMQLVKAREAFGKHFKATVDDVPELAARRMVDLKRARNAFAHDGEQETGFNEFLEDALGVVCHIAFLTTNENRISVYPWEDHLETFEPQSKGC